MEGRISERFLPNWNKLKDNLGEYADFEYDKIRNRYFLKIQVCFIENLKLDMIFVALAVFSTGGS